MSSRCVLCKSLLLPLSVAPPVKSHLSVRSKLLQYPFSIYTCFSSAPGFNDNCFWSIYLCIKITLGALTVFSHCLHHSNKTRHDVFCIFYTISGQHIFPDHWIPSYLKFVFCFFHLVLLYPAFPEPKLFVWLCVYHCLAGVSLQLPLLKGLNEIHWAEIILLPVSRRFCIYTQEAVEHKRTVLVVHRLLCDADSKQAEM